MVYFEFFSELIWQWIGFPILMLLGLYLSFQSGFIQIRKLPEVFRIFKDFLFTKDVYDGGVHPVKAFFASVGGCIGIGNIVAVCTGLSLGGPGALFWLWVAALMGMIVKYAELYVGMKFRVRDPVEGHKGGPMYFLPRAFSWKGIPIIVCILLGIYGVEVYQFAIVVKSVSTSFKVPHLFVTLAFLGLVIYANEGGVKRVAEISSILIPLFVVIYIGMGVTVLCFNIEKIPEILGIIVDSAFTGQAAMGGFIGSTIWMAIYQGVSVGCYTGDVGIGYASIIHSETQSNNAEKQASLAIIEILLDTLVICTMTACLVLVTDVWQQGLPPEQMVQEALGQYFPYMNFFMPLFIVLLGYSTINAYLAAGTLCSTFISPKYGKFFYYLYAIPAFIAFTYYDTSQVLTIMLFIAACLLVINLCGIFFLRKDISYKL